MMEKAEIGNKLKRLRLERGLSQTELADICGMNQTQVTRYEQGVNRPTPKMLDKLANGLDVAPEYFTDIEDTPLSDIDAEYARLRAALYDPNEKFALKTVLRNFYVANQNKKMSL